MEFNALIVDDEKMIIDSLYMILQESGVFKSVIQSQDGVDACRKITNQSFDLIILDINMPKLDGLGVLKAINQSDRNPEVLLMSGGFNQDNVLTAQKMGIKHVLAKPFNAKKFVEKLSVVLKDIAKKKKKGYRIA